MFGDFYGSNLRRRPHGCLRRWNLRGQAEEEATTPFVVATWTDVDRRGAGYGVPPLVPKGGHHARRGQKLGTSTEVGPAEYFELSSDDGRPTGGERPAALPEPLPRGKVQRHAGIGYEIFDVPVLQMVEQLPNVTQFFAAHLPVVAEPVIEVPMILPDRVPQRVVERPPPQMAEQLEPAYVLAVLASMVFSRRELLGLLPGQGSTASGSRFLEEVADNPVPQGRRRCGGGLQGSRARQNSTAADVEQIVDIPARRGVPDFLPHQSSTASSSSRLRDDADEGFQVVFQTFPRRKKCEVGFALGVGTAPRVEPIHAASLLCGR